MTRPIVLFAHEGSELAAALAARLAAVQRPHRLLALDAPLGGEAVTVRGARVVWQGCELDAAGALWLAQPLFPWPQPLLPPCELPDLQNVQRWIVYQREARALAVAALQVAAETVPALNPIGAAHLAVAPAVALDLLAARGLPVQPWRIASFDAPGAAAAAAVDPVAVDAAGRDRWHQPAALPAAAPRLSFDGYAGAVVEVLVVGGEAIGARSWTHAAAWAAVRNGEREQAADPDAGTACDPAPWAQLGCAATAALALEMAAVSVAAEPRASAAIMLVDAAPDLDAWERLLDGAVSAALARRLGAVADAFAAGANRNGARP